MPLYSIGVTTSSVLAEFNTPIMQGKHFSIDNKGIVGNLEPGGGGGVFCNTYSFCYLQERYIFLLHQYSLDHIWKLVHRSTYIKHMILQSALHSNLGVLTDRRNYSKTSTARLECNADCLRNVVLSTSVSNPGVGNIVSMVEIAPGSVLYHLCSR